MLNKIKAGAMELANDISGRITGGTRKAKKRNEKYHAMVAGKPNTVVGGKGSM